MQDTGQSEKKMLSEICNKRIHNWAGTWQNQQMTLRPANTQINLGIHPVWSVFTVRSKDSQITRTFFRRTAKTLMRLCGCPGWSETSLDVRVILFVLSCSGSYFFVPFASVIDAEIPCPILTSVCILGWAERGEFSMVFYLFWSVSVLCAVLQFFFFFFSD